MLFAIGALVLVFAVTAPAALAGGCSSLQAGYGGSGGNVQSSVAGYGGSGGSVQSSVDCVKKGGVLPFTGLDLRFVAVASVLLLLGGFAIRRMTRARASR
jgi:uncharacterized protein YceK